MSEQDRPPQLRPFEVDAHIFVSAAFKSVVAEIEQFYQSTPTYPLPPTSRFAGAGVYGIYYTGPFEAYRPITAVENRELLLPIYIGKAVPPGWRTSRGAVINTVALHQRLREHARSIRQTALPIEDFFCRFVIMTGPESNLIGAAEAALIRRFRPLWNAGIDGFGNHDPGKGRYNQARSHWDILHPGRSWVGKLMGDSSTEEEIRERIARFLALPPEAQEELVEQALVREDDETQNYTAVP